MSYSNIQTIELTPVNTNNEKNNQLRMMFPVPFEAKNCEIALTSAYIYYSWNNITSAYGNNSCAYNWNGTSYPVNFPDIFYSVEDISDYIQYIMLNNGHYLLDDNAEPVYYISLATNISNYAVTLTCTKIPTSLPSGWTNPASITLSGNVPLLTINNAEFGKLIGFTVASYPSVTQSTTYAVNSSIVPQISIVTSIKITCNMVNNARNNNITPQSIYSFSPTVPFGSQIILDPSKERWMKVIDSQYQFIDIQLRDQNNNDLAILDTNINMTLSIRTIENKK